MKSILILILTLAMVRASEFILTPSQDDNAIQYHLFMSVGTNDFNEVSTIGTNTYFHLTNDFIGKVRFYVRSEDESGNLSEPSNVITQGIELKRPVLILQIPKDPQVSIDYGSSKTNHISSQTRELLIQRHNARMKRMSIKLPPPPLP